MSITYPEAPSSAAPKKVGGAAIMNAGSALFPNSATVAPARAAKAHASKSTPLVWVAAPVAVVLIGGAVYLSATHQKAAPSAPVVSRTTTMVTTPAAAPAASLKVQPVAPVVAQTTRVTHVQTSVRTTGPAPRANAAPHVTRTTTVSRDVTTAAPIATPVQAAPVTVAPSQTAPTPGTFAFTPATPEAAAPTAGAVSTTPDTVTTAPAPAPSLDAQPAPQA